MKISANQNNTLPHGFDYCTWEEADHVLLGEKWFSIELLKHKGSIDSFKIFFEPGESEIGIHQAEFCLGMSPIKQNEHFGLEEGETPKEEIVKVDFAYIRDRTAADVRQVAGLLLDCARDIGQGDMAVFEVLIDDQLDLWRQMLNLRYFALQEQKGEFITVNH